MTLTVMMALAATLHAPVRLTVPPAYRRVGIEYEVPSKLLFAVALTESGRPLGRRSAPWPWTLNVNGRPYRYDTREAAEEALARFLDQGLFPDVGLMQISWRYHADLLGDPRRALDPWFNLRAGASLLRRAYRATGDWWSAVGRYHSATPSLSKAYRRRVAQWHRRIG